MIPIVFTLFQTLTFLFLHDVLIEIAIAMGASSHVGGGVGWGLKIYWGTFIFAAICLVGGFLGVSRILRQRLYIALTSFGLFSLMFVPDIFYLAPWAYPKRAVVVIVAALLAITLPLLQIGLFGRIEGNFRNKTPRRASNRLIESR